MKTLKIILLTLLISFTYSCEEEEEIDITSENPTSDAIIYADFINNGTTQSLTLDESKTSGPIQIENEVVFTTLGTRFNFEFSGVTFIDNNNVFKLNNIISQRLEDGVWGEDNENFLGFTKSKSLDIVLILDVSSSLGANLPEIKNSAILVLNQIFADNSEAKVSIIKFSRGNVAKALSSNQFELSQFISSNTSFTDTILGGGTYFLEGQNETGLYEAMLKGIDILNNSNARGQGLITFTDGANNFQFLSENENRQVVVDALNSSTIKSYTIGFIGNNNQINDVALNELAIRGDFSKPTSIEELNQIFTLFSNSIGAIYDLTYDTNNGPFSGTKPYRFLIDLDQLN